MCAAGNSRCSGGAVELEVRVDHLPFSWWGSLRKLGVAGRGLSCKTSAGRFGSLWYIGRPLICERMGGERRGGERKGRGREAGEPCR